MRDDFLDFWILAIYSFILQLENTLITIKVTMKFTRQLKYLPIAKIVGPMFSHEMSPQRL